MFLLDSLKNVGIIFGEDALNIIHSKSIQDTKIRNKAGFYPFLQKLTAVEKSRCNFVDDMGFGTFGAEWNDISGQRALFWGPLL